MKKNCYIISSAMMSKTSPENTNVRLFQTLHTTDSINARDKNADIFILDTGSGKVSGFSDKIWASNVKVFNWQDHKRVTEIDIEARIQAEALSKIYTLRNGSDIEALKNFIWTGYVKNVTEGWTIQEFFNTHDLSGYDKVFKLSGRYSLGPNFDLNQYNNKCTFRSQGALTDGTTSIASTAWCFQGQYFNEFKTKWDSTIVFMLDAWSKGCIKDLESSIWNGFGMSEEERQITYVPFLGIIGIVNTHDGKNLVVSQ